MAGDETGKAPAGGAPAEAPDGTLSQQLDALRRQVATTVPDDALRRRIEVVAAIGLAYEEQLRLARRNLRQLEDLFLPVCMFCKRVRTDESYWERIERFFSRNADITFSHGICPSCFDERFGVAGAPAAAPARPAAPPRAPPPTAEGVDEEALRELRDLLEDPGLRVSPQHPALRRAVDRCARSLARYRKAIEIGDGYQDEFRQRLERAVRSDGLTGFATRAAAVEAIEDTFERARAGRLAAIPALVIVELRGLRALNRRHGYTIGDRALVAASRALRTSASTAFLRARWSGNAFALLVDADQAPRLVQGVLEALRGVVIHAGEEEISFAAEAGLARADAAAAAAAWVAAAEEAVGTF